MDGRPMWNHSKYWVRALALNALYARQHGYHFLLARPTLGPWLGRSVRSLRPALSWCKLKILAQLLGERLSQRPPRCSWVVYLDSDAVVHQHGMPLSSHLMQSVFVVLHLNDWPLRCSSVCLQLRSEK